MATHAEKVEGERFSESDGRIPYIVEGTTDRDTAQSEVESDAPNEVDYGDNTLVLQGVEVTARYVDITDAAACIWDAEAIYRPEDETPVTNSQTWRFDIAGETANMKSPIARKNIIGASNPSELSDVPINGKDGVDIDASKFSWTETHYLPAVYVDWDYFKTLYLLRGNVNDAQFRTFERGEVRFLDHTGAYRPEKDDFKLDFKFVASPNRDDVTAGPYTGISKGGHDYIWVQYKKAEKDSDAQNTIDKVFVDRLYYFVDFSKLKIGTGAYSA